MNPVPRVLLVEDNPITRKLVRFVLRNDAVELLEASDGATALQLAASHPPRLIMQDLLLPDMDGFELVSRLRRIAAIKDVPILAFSGFLSQLDEKRISAAGFSDLITKPIEPSQFLRIVRGHLPAEEQASGEIGHGRRLILADDDAVQRKLTSFKLTRLGFDVVSVADGVEALEAARRSPPAVIVSDVMMPRLDGFGLSAAIRQDERLRDVPIVLLTSTYVDPADRELGRKAGADAFVVRTPDMREITHALERVLGVRTGTRAPIVADPQELEHERAARVLVQLERQVALTAGATQQCAVLSAELAVLNAISEAIVRHEDIETVLRETLAACFDAASISVGALYLTTPDGGFRTYRVGSYADWSDTELDSFFGDVGLLHDLIARRSVSVMVSSATQDDRARRFLARSGLKSALVVPLTDRTDSHGALVMLSKDVDLSLDDRALFGQAVGNQISAALALAKSFEERAASERAARSQTALLKSVFSGITDAIVVAESGRCATWNAAAAALFGLTEDRDAGHPLLELSRTLGLYHSDKSTPLDPDDTPMSRALRGESVDRVELFVRNARRPQGAWLSAAARPLNDDDGAVRGAVGVFHDVTAERLAQEQLVVSDRMASVGMLAASVGHEINNPLACVIGNLEMAADDLAALSQRHQDIDLGELPDEIREAIDGAERVRQIVRDLKIFSRGEDEQHGPVDVESVLESSIRMAWNEIRHRARIVRRYGGVPVVEGAEARLGQVFLNLIVNAAQAISPGRADQNEIRISTRVAGTGRIIVDIEDTGPGIPPEVMSRLFTPFVTTKPIGVGTGLGLAICHRLVTGMGGEISAETTPGIGTVFHVALRRAPREADAAGPPSEAAAPATRPPNRGRILVVDDEAMIGVIVGRALKSAHHVTVTTSAADALANIVAGARFDLILCDLMMPVMTGMDFHAALTRVAPEQASVIVFLTAGAFTPQTRAFLESVANRRLEKPFDVSTLRATVDAQLRSGQPE